MREGAPLSPEIKPHFLITLLLELSLQEQSDRDQLGTHRLQGTGHTLKHSGTCCTRDPYPGIPTQIALGAHYISLARHRITITHRYRQAPWPRCRFPHLVACLWATYRYNYHTQPFRSTTVEHNRAVWAVEALERNKEGRKNWAVFRDAVTRTARTGP